jgi:predicted ABC-class ATPase
VAGVRQHDHCDIVRDQLYLRADFSPPIESTGIVNFVCDNCAKSFASCGQDAKYAQPACIRLGREYAVV